MTFREIMEMQADQRKELPPCKYCGGTMIVYCYNVKQLTWTAECDECDLTLGEYPSYEKACEATNGDVDTQLADTVRNLLNCREDTERTYEDAYDFTFKAGPHRECWEKLIEYTGWVFNPDGIN